MGQLDGWLKYDYWNSNTFNDVELRREGKLIRKGTIRVWTSTATGSGRKANDNYVLEKLGLDIGPNNRTAAAHGRWEGFTNYTRGSGGAIYRFQPGDVLIKKTGYNDMLRHLLFYKTNETVDKDAIIKKNFCQKYYSLQQAQTRDTDAAAEMGYERKSWFRRQSNTV